GIVPVGVGNNLAEARAPARIEKSGVVVCFHAYSQFAGWFGGQQSSPAIAPLDVDYIQEDIQKGKEGGCEVAVVTIHWGNEYETKASEAQRQIAYAAIESGAQLVSGHHPHVLQEIEEYGVGLIAFSLGNF